MTLALRNEGPGHGDVEVEVTLTAPTGRTLRERRTIELTDHMQRDLVVDIPAPPDTYIASASAKYPD
ncbi:MAG: hypothetical protein HOV81_00190 [Kofleriaceae bacterium]|nr:hypothetical protein [Kofleriaceae bacterium]